MAKVDTIQTSFAGGEFGPSLYGRTDIAQYQNACEIVENWLIRPYGSAISAPGSRYVATVSNSSLKTRIIPFVFNQTDAYIIEMGDLYMRFFTNRGQIGTPGGTEDLSSLTANTVAFYKMNDNTNSTTVLDTSGSHNGTASVNTATMSTTGQVGTGCFDLDSQYTVTVSDHNDFSFSDTTGTGPFSLAYWLYYDGNSTAQIVISKRDTDKFEWQSSVQNGKIYFATYQDGGASDAQSLINTNQAISTGWHMVVCTYDGRGGASASSGKNIYVDGTIVTDVTRATDSNYKGMKNDTAPVTIGAHLSSGSPTSFFRDRLDAVAIFNKELSSTEAASLLVASANPYQITTVYTEDEIFDVHFTQLNDIIWLAHPSHPPQILTRVSENEWTIADYAFKGGPFLDENDTSTTITPSATTGTINLTASASLFTLSSSTLGHVNSYWAIGGLAQTNVTTGLQEIGYVKITHVVSSVSATATVIKNLKSTAATTMWSEGAWSAVRGYPGKVIFHDSRLWWGRSNHEPQKQWGSKIFEYDNYALDTQDADDALNLQLSSNESNEIQWMASGRNLISGTFGGGFVTSSGADDLAITPDNVSADEEIGIGSASIQPKRIGNFIYYLQRFNKKLRELFYFWDIDSYKAVNRTILSPHVLGKGIVDMDVQLTPDSILYCVRTEGTLAILTREPDQEFSAWARLTTNGTYTSVAVIPSQVDSYEEVWVVVERWINGAQKKYIEFFENPEPPDRQDKCLYLHSALTYDAYESSSLSSTSISLSASSGTVTVTSNTAYFDQTHVNKRVRAIDVNGVTLGEGTITATVSTTSMTLSVSSTFDALTYSAGYWGISVSSVSGLSHLETETVGILADGTEESLTRTVASGVLTLGSDYFVIHAGLSYDQVIYTLARDSGAQRGTAQGKLQRINEIAFKLNRSYLGFQYGIDADNLDMITSVDTTLTQSLTTGVIRNLPFRGGYQAGSQVYIKNSHPLPVEIVSLITTLDTQEK